MLNNKTKDQLWQLRKRYNIDKSVSSKKILIPNLLTKRENLLKQHISEVASKQSDCTIDNILY
jgi:hypothetical protein